jgi:hypothetical protein
MTNSSRIKLGKHVASMTKLGKAYKTVFRKSAVPGPDRRIILKCAIRFISQAVISGLPLLHVEIDPRSSHIVVVD